MENLNAVLDDNKRLGLEGGEMIPLTPSMRVLFEVEDLKVASPATVSRLAYVQNKTFCEGEIRISFLPID